MAAPGLRFATQLGYHIGLGGRVPARPAWAGASEMGCEGGLFVGAGRDDKWAGNGLHVGKESGLQERYMGSRPEGENWPQRFRGKKLFPIFKTFYKFQTKSISIQI
jgi:hypothetical protein